MYISKLILENFRKYKMLNVDFNPNLNVLVGENNSGKTAIIDAIRILLGTQSNDYYRVQREDFYYDGKSYADNFKITCKIEDYIKYQIDYFDIDIGNYFEESIKSVIYYLGFNLRDCNKYFQALKLKYSQIKSNQSTRTSNVLFLHILFPLLLGMKIKRPDEYLKVKNGKGKSNFYNLLNSCESIKDYMGRYIGKDELSNLEKYINQLYEFIYINKNEYDLIIHSSLSITRNSCDVLDGFLSCLGEKVQL